MSGEERAARAALLEIAAELAAKGLVHAGTGNLSVRCGDRIIVSGTGARLGALRDEHLAVIDLHGAHLDGAKPSKEAFLHAAMLRARPDARAVVHTHSTHAAAVSCLAIDEGAAPLPPLTAYFLMRVGELPLLPYFAPGDERCGPVAEAAARAHHALLLRNHGPIVAAGGLREAVDVVEEIEETAKVFFLLGGHRFSPVPDPAALAPGGRATARPQTHAAPGRTPR